MNTDYLRECTHLSHTLSFTETAKYFFISQPLLSKHIANIEREIGFDLFERSKSGVKVTKAGGIFVSACEKLLDGLDEAIEDAKARLSGFEEPIRIGYLYGASYHVLPQAIRRFKSTHPSALLQYTSLEIDEIFPALINDRIDFAITCNLSTIDRSQYEYIDLYPDTLCAIVSDKHPLANQPSISLDDLANGRVIMPRSTFMPDETLKIKELISPVIESLDIMPLIVDLNSIKMALKTDECIAIEFAHLRNSFGEDFAFIPLSASTPKFSVVAAWKKSNASQAIRELADELADCCRGKSPNRNKL